MKRNYKVLAGIFIICTICLGADFFILARAGFFWAVLFSLVAAGPASFLHMVLKYTLEKKALPADLTDLMKDARYGKALNFFIVCLLLTITIIKLYTWLTQ